MSKFEDHDCLLMKQEEDIVKQFIDTGVFISLRRKFRSWCMISRSHPETSRYFKSNAACRTEEIRHLVHNYHMIHLFSMFNLYWEFYMFLLFTAQFLLIPIDASYTGHRNERPVYMSKFMLDMLQISDIVKIFFTGFYNHEKSKVILDCSHVAKRYLKSYFFIDIISSFHSYLYPFKAMHLFKLPRDTSLILRMLNRLKIFRIFRWLTILELFRQLEKDVDNYMYITTMKTGKIILKPGVVPHLFECQNDRQTCYTSKSRQLFEERKKQETLNFMIDTVAETQHIVDEAGTQERFREYMGYSSYLFKGIRVVMIFLVITVWAFSFNFFLVVNYVKTEDSNVSVFRRYYEATLMLLLVSYGKKDIRAISEYAVTICFLCFGFALQLFVYAQILQVWTKYASAENKHHSLHKQFKEYMKYKELPVSLRERIFSYFQFKFHKQFFKESDINNMVSPLLKQEILLHVTRNHIERVDFFRHLPENILMKVVAQLKSEIFLPGDVIISAGTTGTSMFFIYHGTVAVYTPSGKEICHLEDGAHFGEIALILSESRVATVVAVTASELFMLRRSDFLAAIEPFPEFRDQLIALATERLNKTILQSKQE